MKLFKTNNIKFITAFEGRVHFKLSSIFLLESSKNLKGSIEYLNLTFSLTNCEVCDINFRIVMSEYPPTFLIGLPSAVPPLF